MQRLSEDDKRARKIARELARSIKLALPHEDPETLARQRELARARSLRWWRKNRESRNAAKREHYAVNREKLRPYYAKAQRESNARRRERRELWREILRLWVEDYLEHLAAERKARALEMHRKQQARWAKANPDCIAEAQRKWKEKNRDYFRQHDRDRYAADSEKKKARSRAYYAANRERIRAARRTKPS